MIICSTPPDTDWLVKAWVGRSPEIGQEGLFVQTHSDGVGEYSFFTADGVSADEWEQMCRPDILEKNCHSTCPKSLIVTTKMYNPNMKVDILAIPPRKDPDDVCCKWRFSMRDEDDPEYVPVELTDKPEG